MDALFAIQSPHQPRPKRQHVERPRLGRQPFPATCRTCHRTILRVMIDGLLEQTIDPTTLSEIGDQTARLLGIPTYRAPHAPDGPPLEYWARFTPPAGDTRQPTEYLSPAHQCGKPPLPGTPIPVSSPHRTTTFTGPPPF